MCVLVKAKKGSKYTKPVTMAHSVSIVIAEDDRNMPPYLAAGGAGNLPDGDVENEANHVVEFHNDGKIRYVMSNLSGSKMVNTVLL